VRQNKNSQCGPPGSMTNGKCVVSFLQKCGPQGNRHACPRCINTYGCGNCDVDQNECSDFWLFDGRPCMRGTCEESSHDKSVKVGDVKCNCPAGYTGKVCHVQTMIVRIKKCKLAKQGMSQRALSSRSLAQLFNRMEYEAMMINGKTSKRGTQECTVEIKPKKCPDENSACNLNPQDKQALIQVLKSQQIQGDLHVIDTNNGYVSLWASGNELPTTATYVPPTTTKSTSNIKVVVEDESTNFPIMIISLLVAIAVLGVIGVVCVKHKSGLGGGGKGSEPAHVEMEVI